jgi:hypothetical protein
MQIAELAERAGNPRSVVFAHGIASFDVAFYRGTGLELRVSAADPALPRAAPEPYSWGRAGGHASRAFRLAFAGRDEDAQSAVVRALPAVQRAGGGVVGYTPLICRCCEALWHVGRADFAGILEQSLLTKTLAGDFRCPGVDARRAMAQLCALTGRPAEAHEWFERARAVLDEQGARPLRALVDLDEAWMEVRRGRHGDRERARALLDVACEQFHVIGMPGWIEHAEALRGSAGAAVAVPAAGERAARVAGPARDAATLRYVFRCDGDYWTIVFETADIRFKDSKGMQYLAHLLRHPGREVHVFELMDQRIEEQRPDVGSRGVPILDAAAKAAYRRRLAELDTELAEAVAFNDSGRAEQLRAEIDAIGEQFAAAVGLGGRDRVALSASERARSTVTHRIKTAIKRIAMHSPALADHLANRVKTGTFCVYRPDPTRAIEWTL